MADTQKEVQEERPDVRLIPENFMNSGRLFNGMVETRNAVEAVIVAVIVGLFAFTFSTAAGMSDIAKVAIVVISAGVPGIIALVGVNGDSFSQFLLLFINYMKNKRKLRYRRIVKNAKTTGSRVKSRPTNTKKKTSRTSSKN